MPTYDLERLARRRAGAKMGFYVHATAYVAVNLLLIAVQTAATPQFHWALFPAAGWGLGLALHGIAVFFASPGSALRQRMVEAERRRLGAPDHRHQD